VSNAASSYDHSNQVVENDASVAVIEGLNALGDMFIRHNALNMMKITVNNRPLIQAIEHGFQLIAQMIDSRVRPGVLPRLYHTR
jgi:hypothetical protein